MHAYITHAKHAQPSHALKTESCIHMHFLSMHTCMQTSKHCQAWTAKHAITFNTCSSCQANMQTRAQASMHTTTCNTCTHMYHMHAHACTYRGHASKACKQTSLYVYIMQQACLAAKHVQKTKNDPCMQAACMHQYSMTSIQTMHACTFAQQPCLHLPRPTMQDLQQNM